MLKRLLVMAAALVLFTAACGDDDDDATPTDPADTEAPAPDGDDAPDGDTASGDAEVIADPDLVFDPDTVEISAGETVVWQNTGGIPHTVTSTGGDLDFDEALPDGSSVSITFDDAGTYEYRCAIHPVMTGEVVVS
jgi:plastocyanin